MIHDYHRDVIIEQLPPSETPAPATPLHLAPAAAREAYTPRGTRAALRGNKALRGPRARPVRSRFSKGKALAKNL